jgi:hypothetical protein
MVADTRRVRVTPNLVWGLCLVFVGTALVLDRLQIVRATELLRFWPVGLILLGVAFVVQALRGDDGVAPARHQKTISPGHIIALVFLIVFFTQTSRGTVTQAESGETVSSFAMMGRDQRLSQTTRFRGGELASVMGESLLDLRQSSMAPGEQATIDVFTLMGGIVIRVPDDWIVEIQTVPVMGGVRDRRGTFERPPTAPRIVVRGAIIMGGLAIRSS